MSQRLAAAVLLRRLLGWQGARIQGKIAGTKDFASAMAGRRIIGIRVLMRVGTKIGCLGVLMAALAGAASAQTNATVQAALAEAEKGAAAAQFRLGMLFLNGKE